MDGALPAPAGGLPPIQGGQTQPMFPPPRQQQGYQQPGVNPVGRPLADPDAQEAKIQRTADRRRLESILPKQATDSKIHVYKLKGSRVPPGARPTLIILASELEAARESNTEPDDFIAQKLMEKFTDGRFQCSVIDRSGKRVSDIQPWEIALGADAEGDDDLEDDDLEDDDLEELPGYDPRNPSGIPGAPFAQGPSYPGTPTPPAPPPLDVGTLTRSLRDERSDEARRSSEMMSVVTAMMQSQQQQMIMAQQQQQARDEQNRRDAAEREERYRREAFERDERAEKRRAEFRQTLLAAAPLLLPVVEKLFGLNKEKGLDPTTTVLLEMVKQKAPDSDVMKSMAGVMAEMTKSQMELQGRGAAAAVEMQAKASGVVFDNMMKTMKELMDSKPGGGEKEDSTLEQIAKIAGHVIPALQQGGMAQPLPTPPAPSAPAEVDAQVVETTPAAPPAPVQRKRQPPQQRTSAPGATQPPPQQKKEFTEAQRISGSLDAIRRLSTAGSDSVPASQRWTVLEWVANTLPPDVVQTIATKDRSAVIERCQTAVMARPELIGWLSDAENLQFLEDALSDLKALVLNAATPELKAKTIEANRMFVQRRIDAATGSVAKQVETATTDAANAAGAPPIAGPGSKGRTRGKRLPPTPPPEQPKTDSPPTEG